MSVGTQLPIAPAPQAATGLTPQERERDRLIGQAKLLSWLSLAWMTVEGAVGIAAALLAGSVALLGFGIDSVIEGAASVIVIWRFTGSRRLAESEGTQNLLCAYMAVGVLVGLLANAVVGWWWLDPVVALAIAALAVHEGRESWSGEGCCAGSPIPGEGECREDCCA